MPYKNKEDQKRYATKHYLENKELYKNKAKEHNNKTRLKTRLFVDNYLKNNPCVDCGETDIIVLEFDHVRGEKLHNIANMLVQSYGLDAICKEIEKCEVRCANCHRRQTHKRRNK